MSLSKKIILALSVSAAYLTIVIGCSVDDPDVEKKGVFKCQNNQDCLTGSQCVKAKDSDPYGECIREKDIDHCRDNDRDGFSTETAPEYANECGFSDAYPRDPDDGNPLIFPNAPELCDGVDNSGDGCVDGIKNEKTDKCEDLIEPCWGPGDYTEYDKSACSAQYIGVTICIGGKQVHGVLENGKIVEDKNNGSCPKTQEDLERITKDNGNHRYHQISNDDVLAGKGSDLEDGFDNNCDGVYDFIKCEPDPNTKCYQTATIGSFVDSDAQQANYNIVKNKCGEGECACLGTLICVENVQVCGNNGAEITKESVKGSPCENALDSD